MGRLDKAEIRVVAYVMGDKYEVQGLADISDGIHTDIFAGAIQVDPDLVTRKVKQELAASLRAMADKLEGKE